jgi:hypothetical protein
MNVLNLNCFLFITLLNFSFSINLFDSFGQLDKQDSNLINAVSGASMTSLSIMAGEADEAELRFGCPSNFYSFNSRGQYKDFLISNVQRPILSVNRQNDIMIFSSSIDVNKDFKFTGQIKIRGTTQWRLYFEEDFSKIPVGWSNNTISECGGINMLGGYCNFGGGEVSKTYDNLPIHNMIRIEATFHFIDAWDTETGFMRINNGKDNTMSYAWIDRYSAFIGNSGIDVCGGRWPEGKFAVPIDVSIPHKDNKIQISFGSTIEQDPCDQSFGVSGIRIYIK